MTNRNSHTHGHTQSNQMRPKSAMSKRRNKANARPRALARQAKLKEAFAKGN